MPKNDFDPSGKREICFLFAGGMIVCISLFLDWYGINGPMESWFQRAGSLLVILGAVSESIHVEKVISADKGATGERLTRRQKFVIHSGFVMALIGTVIWGFGDLVLRT